MARLHPPNPPTPPSPPPAGGPRGLLPKDRPLQERVARVIELIRPAVQADGGDLELVGITPPPDAMVQIRLHGACVGCPSSTVTLKSGIERNLREHIPEIKGVVAVD